MHDIPAWPSIVVRLEGQCKARPAFARRVDAPLSVSTFHPKSVERRHDSKLVAATAANAHSRVTVRNRGVAANAYPWGFRVQGDAESRQRKIGGCSCAFPGLGFWPVEIDRRFWCPHLVASTDLVFLCCCHFGANMRTGSCKLPRSGHAS